MFNKLILILLFIIVINPGSVISDPLPTDYPTIVMKNVNNPSPGYFFLANPAKISNYGNFCMIVDNDGITKSYKRTIVRGYDLNMQPNGLFSYADAVLPKGWFWANVVMYVTDVNFAVVDSFQCGNGYQADMHEFKWLPNGHVFLLAQDPQYVDLSKYFKGGNPNALVAGTIIQELDANKNVVFQWRSWDHLSFDETYEDTLQATVNPFHFNALDIDKDGNILVSVRHTCQIIKINRQTSEIMWRLGGKKNQFTFINDYAPINKAYFSHQHNIKFLPNGNITLYDNGWIRNPQFSRAVEYKIDETNMTATKVWEYRHTPDIYTELMGSVQRLKNGNTVICWGGPNPEGRETLTEVHPDNTIALEMTLPPLFTCYRVYKYELPACQPSASINVYEVMQGNSYKFQKGNVESGIQMTFNELESSFYNGVNLEINPCSSLYPKFYGKTPIIYDGRLIITTNEIDSSKSEINFDVSKFPEVIYPAKTIVFKRDTIGVGYFKPLETVYDESNNVLKAYTKNFGEYILGWYEDTSNDIIAPTLISPISGIKLNMNKTTLFSWSNNGIFNSNQIQISDNIQFSNMILDTVLNHTFLSKKSLPSDKYIYWRVRTNLGDSQSSWSNIDSFTIVKPFLNIEMPNGGEVIKRGSKSNYTIRWKDNLKDSVKIELMRQNFDNETIIDKFISYTGAYVWQVKAETPLDSTYKIKITSIKDGSIISISENTFTVTDGSTSVKEYNKSNYQLDISPNPARNSISISLNNGLSPINQIAYISICNSQGVEVKRFNSNELLGQNSINYSTEILPSGVYYCTINIENQNITSSFVVVK